MALRVFKRLYLPCIGRVKQVFEGIHRGRDAALNTRRKEGADSADNTTNLLFDLGDVSSCKKDHRGEETVALAILANYT